MLLSYQALNWKFVAGNSDTFADHRNSGLHRFGSHAFPTTELWDRAWEPVVLPSLCRHQWRAPLDEEQLCSQPLWQQVLHYDQQSIVLVQNLRTHRMPSAPISGKEAQKLILCPWRVHGQCVCWGFPEANHSHLPRDIGTPEMIQPTYRIFHAILGNLGLSANWAMQYAKLSEGTIKSGDQRIFWWWTELAEPLSSFRVRDVLVLSSLVNAVLC